MQDEHCFRRRRIEIGKNSNEDGYYMDYDLSANGEINNLTISCVFWG